ncbi:hypothetical protein ACIBSV_15425 [Embleya sp. NPDC050154]|uniref:hypothetical protein n=1 Tax=Embleya sp. NPDC050154 TaxID=3363988 RepID=UPI0037A9C43B
MPRKKPPLRYATPQVPLNEKQFHYVASELCGTVLVEASEVTPAFAEEARVDYWRLTGTCGLTPTPDGWGLLHCTVLDKARGRRRRITLATEDLTYHRSFFAACRAKNRTTSTDLAMVRYPYWRWGWPGPAGQSGSWPGGNSIVWRPTYRDAAFQPGDPDDRHLHGVLCTSGSEPRHVYLDFRAGSSRKYGKWLIFTDGPFPGFSVVIVPDANIELLVPPEAEVLPGWPVPPPEGPCSRCD